MTFYNDFLTSQSIIYCTPHFPSHYFHDNNMRSQSHHRLLSSPLFFTHTPQKPQSLSTHFAAKPRDFRITMAALTPAAATPTTTFGFTNLMNTFTVDVQRAENRPLNVPLIAPFTIASSRLDKVENVAIRIELRNGSVGWGEAPILPFVTAEDQPTAMAKAAEACEFLRRTPALTLGSMLREIGAILTGHEFASVSETEMKFKGVSY